MKKLYLSIITGLLIAGLLTGCGKKEEPEKNDNWFSTLNTTNIDDVPVTSEIFSDKKITLINTWATFCSPCIGEMPELEELYQEYQDGPVGIAGLLVDSSTKEMIAGLSEEEKRLGKEILEATGVSYPQLTVSEELLQTDFKRIIQYPTTFFVDADGNFVGKPVAGAKSKAEWKKIIEERLAEAGEERLPADKEKEAKKAAAAILTAFVKQDADALDQYLPGSGLGSFVYEDPEGFQMYTDKLSWEITGIEEEENLLKVKMNIRNVDMVKILMEHPPIKGAQMPDPTPEQIKAAETKQFDYIMPLKKTENGYILNIEEDNLEDSVKTISELLNIITGGGYEYLDSLLAEEEEVTGGWNESIL